MTIKFRSIFISDVHLGTKDAHSEHLFDMLENTEAEFIYLVGDIVDLWNLKKGWHWPQVNNAIVSCLLEKIRQGTTVTYIPGNHDERLRDYVGGMFYGILVCQDTVHTTAEKKQILLIHGDEFDSVVMANKWLVHLGNWTYDYVLLLNRYYNVIRRRLGFPYWSLSNYLKTRTSKAMQYISNFENAVIQEAKRRGMSGVVCGHIHHPTVKDMQGFTYANTGDWVENCSAVVELEDGRLDVLRWTELQNNRRQVFPELRAVANA